MLSALPLKHDRFCDYPQARLKRGYRQSLYLRFFDIVIRHYSLMAESESHVHEMQKMSSSFGFWADKAGNDACESLSAGGAPAEGKASEAVGGGGAAVKFVGVDLGFLNFQHEQARRLRYDLRKRQNLQRTRNTIYYCIIQSEADCGTLRCLQPATKSSPNTDVIFCGGGWVDLRVADLTCREPCSMPQTSACTCGVLAFDPGPNLEVILSEHVTQSPILL
jgi:hypothetical protein